MSETSAVVEKSLRSVFVGNIPYEATEEKLRDIFSQVGPVLSFKLMYDRESGKPKGYGFCEYKDQETALSAMRNLNGYEIGGRPLRVDNACTEKSRMEMQSLMMGPVVESPYGAEVEPNKAPEAISNAVASLPPEQMYELMRQMKLCVRNNPQEARTMLMNNPQLAYALLQAQVVMRIIDPKTAVQILHGARESMDPHSPHLWDCSTSYCSAHSVPGPPSTQWRPPPSLLRRQGPLHHPISPPGTLPLWLLAQGAFRDPRRDRHPQEDPPFQGLCGGGPRGPPPSGNDQDMRLPPPGMGGPPPPHENYGAGPHHDYDNRFQRDPRGEFVDQRGEQRFREPPPPPRDSRDTFPQRSDPRDVRDRDRDSRSYREQRGSGGEGGRRPQGTRGEATGTTEAPQPLPPPPAAPESRDPRAARGSYPQDKDFRSGTSAPLPPMGGPTQAPPRGVPAPSSTSSSLPTSLAGQDQEKASLIMQVLQLSDEQIKMLPPEQRASILQLKEQIQRSQH
ncbi:LOW QUALITY PROTEIN: cleavage stimulation factor subunit 2-like [Scylla paramamosain]|uniref:LOW QUALITY PROTEIN: cleavage stimulation factor subunit 2-like n=1 Tax=Scylla paramamosain TaxID=85552 RepID=UPI0030829172